MRVNVDDVAFMDRRFKLLGGRLGMTWQEALGRCLPVWALAYSRRSTILPAGDVDALAEREGFAAAMIGVELGVEHGDGVYLCGVADRIDYLLLQDAKRAKARQAKLAAAGVPSPVGRSRGTKSDPGLRPPGTSPGTLPGQGPYSPDLDLDHPPDRESLARAIPSVPSTTPAQNSFDAEAARHRANGDLAQATWQRLSELRLEHAERLKLEGVIGLPAIHPGGHRLAFEDLRQRIREEGSEARTVCAHVIRVLDEQATETKSIEWLSEKAFGDKAWRKARETTLKPKRKPAERAPEQKSAPIAPENLAGSAELAKAWEVLGIAKEQA